MRLSLVILTAVVLAGSAHGRTEIHDAVGVRVIEDEEAVQAQMSPRRLQDATMKEVVRLHNQYRATVKAGKTPNQPGAKSMPNLRWDSGLAKVAQDYANKCIWGHNPKARDDYKRTNGALKGSYVGENLYASSGTSNPAGAAKNSVTAWYDEYKYYTYATRKCQSGKVCGHYTAVVWAKTTLIGCAVKVCSRGLSGIAWSQGTIVVCNYAVGGNVVGQFPYEKSNGNPKPPKKPTKKPTKKPAKKPTKKPPGGGGNGKPKPKKPTKRPTKKPGKKPGSGVKLCKGLRGTRTTPIRNTSPRAKCGNYRKALKKYLPCVSNIKCLTAKAYPGVPGFQQVKLQFTCDRKTWNRLKKKDAFQKGMERALSRMGFKFIGQSMSSGAQKPTEITSETAQTQSSSSSSGKGNTTGVIVGAVLGSVCCVVLVGAVIFFMIRKRAQEKDNEYQMMQGDYNPPTPVVS